MVGMVSVVSIRSWTMRAVPVAGHFSLSQSCWTLTSKRTFWDLLRLCVVQGKTRTYPRTADKQLFAAIWTLKLGHAKAMVKRGCDWEVI
jgi:hypothetical protein